MALTVPPPATPSASDASSTPAPPASGTASPLAPPATSPSPAASATSTAPTTAPTLPTLLDGVDRLDRGPARTSAGRAVTDPLAPRATTTPRLTVLPRAPQDDERWKLRFSASHAFTSYHSSDVTMTSSRYNIAIKDYEWAERGSREYFRPATWMQPGNNPLQIIDEPTNTFTLSLEKNANEFFFSAFHPKYLQAPGQVKHIVGTIDGTPVDYVGPVNRPFDGYDQIPGESEILRNENTHGEMQWELGYGRRITLLADPRFGSLSYRPAVSAGIMTGTNYSAVVAEGEWWISEDRKDPYRLQGFGGSIGNRLEWRSPDDRLGVFYENKISAYRLESGFLDGTQRYDLRYTSNNVGVTWRLWR